MSFGLYALSGLGVGFLVGMTGVGGGSLMTPVLILLFGLHPATAVGSDLLYASATKVVGTAVHGRFGGVDWRVTGLLACGSVPMAAATLVCLSLWAPAGANSPLVSIVLGAVLLLTAVLLVFRSVLLGSLEKAVRGFRPATVAALTIATGAVLGCIVTLTSVGAGAIGMTALLLLYPHLPPARLVGSDLAHAVPLTLLAGFGHWLLGDVDFGLVGSLLTGAVPGVIVGSLLSHRVPDGVLRGVLASVLAVVAARLMTA